MTLGALMVSPVVPGRIHRVGFGWINVGGTVYEQDRVVHPDGVSGPWWRRKRHWFLPEDARRLAKEYEPEILILGTGWMGMMRIAQDEIAAYLEATGIDFEAHRTPDAVKRHQDLLSRSVHAVAAFHLTC